MDRALNQHQQVGLDRHSTRRAEIDRLIAEIAGDAHGVVDRGELVGAGVSPTSIDRRAADGRLHRVYPGVYVVGSADLSRSGRRLAAVKACGPGACLRGRTAASQHGIRQSNRSVVEVASASHRGATLEGIESHRVRDVASLDIVLVDSVPCTSVERTLIDLAGILREADLRSTISRANQAGMIDFGRLRRLIAECGPRRGLATLRRLIAIADPGEFLRSELERRLLNLIVEAGLPRPLVNTTLAVSGGPFEVDFLWPEQRVFVETDGSQHAEPIQRRTDLDRDAALTAAGYRGIRRTWGDVTERPTETTDLIRRLLRSTSPHLVS